MTSADPAFDPERGSATCKVFISWSGPRSRAVADALYAWLPLVLQNVRPWMSSHDIGAGRRWNPEIAGELDATQTGILCLTPENLSAPWLLFEAGALAKSVATSRVIPYLIDLEIRALTSPLSDFQAVRADEKDTRTLITNLNEALGEKGLTTPQLEQTFDAWWPRLNDKLAEAKAMAHGGGGARRNDSEILDEILEIVRGLSLSQTEDLHTRAMRRALWQLTREIRTTGYDPAVVHSLRNEMAHMRSGALEPPDPREPENE